MLQVKEAQPSVLEPYAGPSELGHHGKRVVLGQRLVQAAGDIFLAWCDGPRTGNQYYVRQLWDFKGQGDPMAMDPRHLRAYGELCAWILARSHARTGDAVQIAGYLGKGSSFDRAIAAYPGREALVDVPSGRRWTYAEFGAAVDEVARGLLAKGVTTGDRVGIWAVNCPEWVLTQYATARIGAVMVNINPAYRAHELEFVLRQAGVTLLIASLGLARCAWRRTTP